MWLHALQLKVLVKMTYFRHKPGHHRLAVADTAGIEPAPRHDLVSLRPLDATVLLLEGDVVFVGCDQAAVGDRRAIGGAGEMGQHRFRPGNEHSAYCSSSWIFICYRRLNSDSLSGAGILFQDDAGLSGPWKGVGLAFHLAVQASMAHSRSATLLKAPRRICWRVISANGSP